MTKKLAFSLFFATYNPHKLREARSLMKNVCEVRVISELGCTEELPETTGSLEGNSLQKAEYIHKKYGVNCFAEDSGLFVEALRGDPSVYSARYAGVRKSDADNIKLLLKNMSGKSNRKAYFKAVITLAWRGNYYPFEGRVDGFIVDSTRGKQGFGYDPVFVPVGHQKTFAELGLEAKQRMSHRARALGQLLTFLKKRPYAYPA